MNEKTGLSVADHTRRLEEIIREQTHVFERSLEPGPLRNAYFKWKETRDYRKASLEASIAVDRRRALRNGWRESDRGEVFPPDSPNTVKLRISLKRARDRLFEAARAARAASSLPDDWFGVPAKVAPKEVDFND